MLKRLPADHLFDLLFGPWLLNSLLLNLLLLRAPRRSDLTLYRWLSPRRHLIIRLNLHLLEDAPNLWSLLLNGQILLVTLISCPGTSLYWLLFHNSTVNTLLGRLSGDLPLVDLECSEIGHDDDLFLLLLLSRVRLPLLLVEF